MIPGVRGRLLSRALAHTLSRTEHFQQSGVAGNGPGFVAETPAVQGRGVKEVRR